MFFLQRKQNADWVSIPNSSFVSVAEAKDFANGMHDVNGKAEPLRIVDENNVVSGWVGLNGWKPSGDLPPVLPHKDTN